MVLTKGKVPHELLAQQGALQTAEQVMTGVKPQEFPFLRKYTSFATVLFYSNTG